MQTNVLSDQEANLLHTLLLYRIPQWSPIFLRPFRFEYPHLLTSQHIACHMRHVIGVTDEALVVFSHRCVDDNSCQGKIKVPTRYMILKFLKM